MEATNDDLEWARCKLRELLLRVARSLDTEAQQRAELARRLRRLV